MLLRTARQARGWIRRTRAKLTFHGTAHHCPVCESSLRTFLPAGDPPRPEALCPVCYCLERHRLLWTVLRDRMSEGSLRSGGRLLHVAPEAALVRDLERRFDYLSVDIEPGRAMVTGDITDLEFQDESFGAVICNHVLEHIRDDVAALGEIHRVLKPGGWASLLVPITGPVTTDAPEGATPEYLKEYHGQDDHIRTYGPDYCDRVTDAGFHVEQTLAGALLGAEEAARLGIPLDELCIIGLKP